MKYRCVTCEQEFDSIPDGAVQLTNECHRVSSYRFTDGTVHHLRRALSPNANHRWHNSPRPDCEFCFPPPKPEPQPEPPVMEQALLQEVQAPVPEIIVEEKPEVVPEIEPDESELQSITILSAAFNRIRK